MEEKKDTSSPSPHLKHADRFLEEVGLDGLHPPGRNLQPELQRDDVKGDQAEQPCQSLLSCNVKVVMWIEELTKIEQIKAKLIHNRPLSSLRFPNHAINHCSFSSHNVRHTSGMMLYLQLFLPCLTI